jgi:ketosteroid isomerase-like protein
MSVEDLTRAAFGLWNARDFDGLLGCYHEDAVWDVSPIGAPGMGEYRGKGEIRRFFEQWLEAFPDSVIEVETFEEHGDWGFAGCLQRVSGGSSGVEVPFRYWGIGHWPGGRMKFVENHTDSDVARAAYDAYVRSDSLTRA